MDKKIGDAELKEKTKKLSIIEASFFSVHDGLGIRCITPFALAIGKNNPHINTFVGLLSSLPSLIGNLSQIYTTKLMERYKRKKILFIGIIIQSLLWFGVIFSGTLFFLFKLNSFLSLIFLTIFYTLLVLAGAFVVPAWTSLMKDIVVRGRGDYFGKRNMIAGIIAILSSLLAGLLLDSLEADKIFIGFFILFFTAFVFRFISGILSLSHYEPKIEIRKSDYFSFFDFLKRARKSNFAKFSLFISFLMLSVYIAGPFFTVYMLKNLNFSYIKWTAIVIIGSGSTLFFMPLWGKFADKYGSIKTLKITGFLIPLIPLIWMLTYFFDPLSSMLFLFLCSLEFFSGFLWAGFNLSYSNFIYDAVTREKTSLCSAYFNVLQGAGIFIGALVGGLLLSANFKLLGLSAFLSLFFLSALMRFFSYAIMMPKIKEIREVQEFRLKKSLNITMDSLNKFNGFFNNNHKN
ncbi:MAG: MFS transporter [Nanoarchaeota archaeon]